MDCNTRNVLAVLGWPHSHTPKTMSITQGQERRWIVPIFVGVIATFALLLALLIWRAHDHAASSVREDRAALGSGGSGRPAPPQATPVDQRGVRIAIPEVGRVSETEKRRDEIKQQEFRRRLNAYAAGRIVARSDQATDAEYSQVFGQLDVPAERIPRLKNGLSRIKSESMAASDELKEVQILGLNGNEDLASAAASRAEAALAKLADSRRQSVEELSASMSPEAFESYRQYELAKPAQREFSRILEFAKSNAGQTIGLKQDDELLLLRILMEAEAYTMGTRTWSGPLDPPPTPRVGSKSLAEGLEIELSQGLTSANQLLRSASQSGLGSDILRLLAEYYQGKVSEVQQLKDRQSEEQSLSAADRLSRDVAVVLKLRAKAQAETAALLQDRSNPTNRVR